MIIKAPMPKVGSATNPAALAVVQSSTADDKVVATPIPKTAVETISHSSIVNEVKVRRSPALEASVEPEANDMPAQKKQALIALAEHLASTGFDFSTLAITQPQPSYVSSNGPSSIDMPLQSTAYENKTPVLSQQELFQRAFPTAYPPWTSPVHQPATAMMNSSEVLAPAPQQSLTGPVVLEPVRQPYLAPDWQHEQQTQPSLYGDHLQCSLSYGQPQEQQAQHLGNGMYPCAQSVSRDEKIPHLMDTLY